MFCFNFIDTKNDEGDQRDEKNVGEEVEQKSEELRVKNYQLIVIATKEAIQYS